MVLPATVGATDYFIKTGGDDEASGTADGTAWATTAAINDLIAAYSGGENDTFYFNKTDSWSLNETIGYRDGDYIPLPDCTINIDAYGEGADPIIRGDTMRLLWIVDSNAVNVSVQNLDVNGASNLHIDLIRVYLSSGDLTISNNDFDGSVNLVGDPQHAIVIKRVTGNITINNNTIHDMGEPPNPSGKIDTNGISISTQGTADVPASLSIHDNTIYNMQGDAIAINGLFFTGSGISRADIYDNTLYNCGETPGIDIKESSYIYFYRNIVYKNGFGSGGTSGSGSLIVIHQDAPPLIGTPHHIWIYDNYFNGDYDGTQYWMGIGINNGTPVYIYNNKFKNLTPFIYSGYLSLDIYNNLFIVDTTLTGATGTELSVFKTGDAIGYTINFYNNSIYDSANQLIYGIYMSSDQDLVAKNNIIQLTKTDSYPIHVGVYSPEIDYNTYHNANDTKRIYYAGTGYTSETFATYQALGTPDEHANELDGDPEFTTPGTDFTLDNGSNINVDTGATLNQLYDLGLNSETDFTETPPSVKTSSQTTTGEGWERGAYVFTGAEDPPQPTMTKTTSTPLVCPNGQNPLNVTFSFTTDVNAYGRISTTEQTWDDMTSSKGMDNGDGTKTHSHTVSLACGQPVSYWCSASTESGDNGAEATTVEHEVEIGAEQDPAESYPIVLYNDTSGGATTTLYNRKWSIGAYGYEN